MKIEKEKKILKNSSIDSEQKVELYKKIWSITDEVRVAVFYNNIKED